MRKHTVSKHTLKGWLGMSLLATACSSPVYAAGPSIHIGSLYDYMQGNKSTLLKRVRNSGDSTAFVKVTVSEIVYDDNGNSTEVANPDVMPLNTANANTLIASPARLIVPASGMQASRLLYLGQRDKERYFRVRFIPVLPEKDDGFNVSTADAEQYQATLQAGVNVLSGFGSVVFIRPASVHYDTRLEQQDNQFSVHNHGNSTIVLDAFRDCQADGLQCEVATKYHVRPNSRRDFTKAAGRAYRFELIEGNNSKKFTIDK
ncbi:hypothetical protein [Rheinheimera sp. NSM]|uniref:hypothetical protein n=1 Tax=Rheinheimera sp. NSM TaxID=3457884 RepID=UPI0040360A00